MHKGALGVADRHLAKAMSMAREIDDVRLEGRLWLSIADLRRAQNQPGDQAEALHRAVAILHNGEEADLEAQALAALATAMTEQGDTAGADKAWARIGNLYATAGLPNGDRIYSSS